MNRDAEKMMLLGPLLAQLSSCKLNKTERPRSTTKPILNDSSKARAGPKEPAAAGSQEETLDLPERIDAKLVPGEVHEVPARGNTQAEPLSAEAGNNIADTAFLYDNPMDSQTAGAEDSTADQDLGDSEAREALGEMVDMLARLDPLQSRGVGVIDAPRWVASIVRSSYTTNKPIRGKTHRQDGTCIAPKLEHTRRARPRHSH